ncbi:two-component system VirA-like sensor kinase [Arenibaculum pallidiluteum]|uniref:two-component system VirA-like sensor kinase n=1 Tax=Arenibaculum pallidiluteum TaxID=2812559 RepID=UPI001A979607|nr:two-component system VirA-like sensor kinase [Arenibaculum pallidiluteum]
MFIRAPFPFLIVFGLLLGLTILLVHSATPNERQHARILDALRALDLENASLQRDALRARAGMLRNYDPLVRSIDTLHHAAKSLQAAGQIAEGDARVAIEREVSGLMGAIDALETATEEFKSRNALLQNSLGAFSNMLGRLGPIAADGSRAAAELGELANAMFRFSLDSRKESIPEIAALLQTLGYHSVEGVRTLIAHGQIIVALQPAVDELLVRLQAVPMIDRAQALQERYLDAYGHAAARAGLFRICLFAAASALAAYVGYLVLKLRRNAQTLEERLKVEGVIAAISTRFISVPLEHIEEEIADGLARLAEHADVDRARILIGPAGEESSVRREYAWQRDGTVDATGEYCDLVALATDVPGSMAGLHGMVYAPRVASLPDGPKKDSLISRGMRSWLSIPLGHPDRRLGYLIFETFRKEKYWPEDDLALLRMAGEIFANAIERQRNEQEREALEARLAQAHRLESLGTLAGGIAHEFNNILGAILGYGELALSAMHRDSTTRRHVEQIMRAGTRAQAIIDQILAFSRRRERQYRPIAAAPVVAEAIELIRASFPATLVLELRKGAPDATIMGDATELQQVVMNLCTNAAHAMDAQGTLEVGLDRIDIIRDQVLSHGRLAPGSYVRLTVRDTGHGIAAGAMERIFEPFYTTKAVGSGTGLGLPAVHGIVTGHGGALNVRSRPGAGSTFEAYFPRTDDPAVLDDDVVDTPTPRGSGETILIIDDEKQLVLLGEEMLAALGYEAVGFDSPKAALAAFRAAPQRFNIVLTDEVMPEMTGTELAGRLHRISPDVPIVLMTGYSAASSTPRRQAAGIREVLRKPLRSRPLAECIARQLAAVQKSRSEIPI